MLKQFLSEPKNMVLVSDIRGAEFLHYVSRTDRPNSTHPETLVYVLNRPLLLKAVSSKNIRAIILPESFELTCDQLDELADGRVVVVSSNPKELFYNIHNALALKSRKDKLMEEAVIAADSEVHPTAVLGKGVVVSSGVIIGPYSVVGDCTSIGQNTYIGAHVSIGDDGLLWYEDAGRKTHVKHMGAVKIGTNCHIQSHAVIARSSFSKTATIIGDEVNIGFHVSVGHDCVVGSKCNISSHAAIAGHTVLGNNCWVGLGALVSNTLLIGADVSVKIGSVVVDDVEDGVSVSGNFAVRHFISLKDYVRKIK